MEAEKGLLENLTIFLNGKTQRKLLEMKMKNLYIEEPAIVELKEKNSGENENENQEDN